MVDTSEFVLAWPPAALRHELSWVLGEGKLDQDAAELVLQEAFVGEEALEGFRAAEEWPATNPWGSGSSGADAARAPRPVVSSSSTCTTTSSSYASGATRARTGTPATARRLRPPRSRAGSSA